MIIDLNAIDEQTLEHFKGGEGAYRARMFSDESAKIMKGRLVPGSGIGYHKHTGNSEIIYVLQGEAEVCFDGKTSMLHPGQVHYCPENHEHSLTNRGTEDVVFFAVVPELHP